jgi:type I restriction enzyme R subunit
VDRKRTEEEKNSALKQILDNAVVAEGVADVFALAGLDKPNIGLLSDEFLEDLRKIKHRNLWPWSCWKSCCATRSSAHTRNNVVQEKKYGDRLLETLRKYHNRAIETAQVIEELIQMAKDFKPMNWHANKELGLNPDEVAFYDGPGQQRKRRARTSVTSTPQETGRRDSPRKLRKSTTVDWQVRESVRAKLRILVRRTLQGCCACRAAPIRPGWQNWCGSWRRCRVADAGEPDLAEVSCQ